MVIVNMFQNEFQSEFKQCYAVGQQLKYLHSTDWHRKVCCNSSGAEWHSSPQQISCLRIIFKLHSQESHYSAMLIHP